MITYRYYYIKFYDEIVEVIVIFMSYAVTVDLQAYVSGMLNSI